MKIKNKKIISLAVTCFLLFSILSFANTSYADATARIENPLGTATTLQQVLEIVLASVQVLAGILSVIFIILAGLKFVLAGGDPAKIKKARDMLLYVVIGVAILFGAQAISLVIQNTITQIGSGSNGG